MEYAIVIEKGENSYGGYTLDIEGIYAFGDSEAEVRKLLTEAISDRLAELRAEGKEIPVPCHTVEKVKIT